MVDNLGDRIKKYERVYSHSLTPRSCVIIRVDGKAFHTFTKHCEKPFDQKIIDAMVGATEDTAKQMTGFKLGYTQSDEATFFLTDFDNLETQGWFDYKLNKLVSISAAMFTAYFNRLYGSTNAIFDSRAFIVPAEDVSNVFIWRQRDWERNSVQMLARANFSHKELQAKKIPEMTAMLKEKGISWDELDDQMKYGTFVTKNGKLLHSKMEYQDIRTIINGYINENRFDSAVDKPIDT